MLQSYVFDEHRAYNAAKCDSAKDPIWGAIRPLAGFKGHLAAGRGMETGKRRGGEVKGGKVQCGRGFGFDAQLE